MDTKRGSSRNWVFHRLTFEIVAGDFEGAKVEQKLWLSDRGKSMVDKTCWFLGFVDIEELGRANLVGMHCMVYVSHAQDLSGRPTCGVTDVRRLADAPPCALPGTPTPLQPDVSKGSQPMPGPDEGGQPHG